ncbi:ABC transporter permease [Teredinibacter waterburyi]|jgi:ABC-type dipeptide/oligopeptide/nickel transport systems, permease components|uniref:ABC transporter permease n=1 Tax=Teredinibacter waterburyi TaxID=1500538 RepID=UPI00165F5B86|nr:ABC transporter permease [Teredinibacter waterburyi]
MFFKSAISLQELNQYEQGRSLSEDAFNRLKKNKFALFGLIYLSVMIVLAVFAPLLAPYAYDAQDLSLGATPPSLAHWMGTDIFGRDQLTRILHGSRVSLMVGFVATAVALLIGVLWGTIAGYSGGKTDAIMMRIVDVLYALPFTIFIILLTVVFGRSIFLLFLAIGAVEWLTMARIVRGQVMALRQQEFIEAAVSMGLSRWQIMSRHLIPNILGPIIVYTTLTIPSVILLESFLSFLGLGIQPPASSWGSLISYGVETIEEYPWLLIFPSLFLSVTLFALNFLGDGLRDAFDPRSSKD